MVTECFPAVRLLCSCGHARILRPHYTSVSEFYCQACGREDVMLEPIATLDCDHCGYEVRFEVIPLRDLTTLLPADVTCPHCSRKYHPRFPDDPLIIHEPRR